MESLFFLFFLVVITCLIMRMYPTLTKELHDLEDEHLKKVQLSTYSAQEFGQMLIEEKGLSHIVMHEVDNDDTWYDARAQSLHVSDNVLKHYSYLSLAIITQGLMEAVLLSHAKWILPAQRMLMFLIFFFVLSLLVFTGFYFFTHHSQPAITCLYLAFGMFVGYYGTTLIQHIITWHLTWKSLKKHNIVFTDEGLKIVKTYMKGRVTRQATLFSSTLCWLLMVHQIILFVE